jgi:hypothetical protein
LISQQNSKSGQRKIAVILPWWCSTLISMSSRFIAWDRNFFIYPFFFEEAILGHSVFHIVVWGKVIASKLYSCKLLHTGYFTSDNEPDGIENATHNTFANQTWNFPLPYPGLLCKCIVGLFITHEIPYISSSHSALVQGD